MRKKSADRAAQWAQLLIDAVKTPGTLSAAYRQFWNYSVGNQLLAWFECLRRGIRPGPIHTFPGWIELGRHVKKGEKAITLCMPVTVKRKRRSEKEDPHRINLDAHLEGEEDNPVGTETLTVFTSKPRWFVLSQTEGDDYVPTELPEWSEARALAALNIQRISFSHTDGNCQGFARLRQVAVSPIAFLPHKTIFHELAHVVLGHTAEGQLDDHDRTPRSLREVEAESVALIACESLGLPGVSDCRGYIQYWLQDSAIPEFSAQKIFKTADAILKAGYPKPSRQPESD